MGGISTTTGLFSGIDSGQLIQQLLAIEARPKYLAQNRLIQLQTQQAAYMDINSQLSSLKSAAAAFRINSTFDSKNANSSNTDILSATANGTAQQGSYNFLVDRLVSTQQLLSRGFVDSNSAAIGLSSLTFESDQARLDAETALSDLNNGAGIDRGKIKIDGVEVDLSKAATVADVLDAINSADGLTVTASVQGGRFVLDGASTVLSVAGDNTAESLGLDAGSSSIQGSDLVGGVVYGLDTFTTIQSLNDGRGVAVDATIGADVYDLTINVGGTDVNIRLGDVWETVDNGDDPDTFEITSGAVSTMAGALDRINTALSDAGFADVVASLDTENGRLLLTDDQARDITVSNAAGTTTADDLGIAGTFTGSPVTGTRILAGMNSTLLSSINGGLGMNGDSVLIDFTTADASVFQINVGSATTLEELIRAINDDAGNNGSVTASLNANGTGLKITDNTTGAGSLVIGGPGEKGAAIVLGIAGTYADGVANGSNLQHAYMGLATRLDSLNNGSGIGTGDITITDATGAIATISIDDNMKTLGEVIDKINGDSNVEVTARMNDTGDGIVIEDSSAAGTLAIKIEDKTGTVARKLGIEGEATGSGNDNYIDGSFETTLEFDPDDTLDDIVTKINESGSFATATIINDGTGTTPYRLSLTASNTGADGRFIIDSGGFDLGLETLDDGNDAKIFYGSTDPADAILLSSSSNTLDSVIQGVSIDLKTVSTETVTLTVSRDNAEIEGKVEEFVTAFNNVLERLDSHTRYVEDTGERGALLGDGTSITLRQSLLNKLLVKNEGFTEGYNSLVEVGIVIGDGGKLTFDKEAFRQALENDPTAVEKLFTQRVVDPDGGTLDLGDGITSSDPLADTVFTEIGVINQIEEFANDYITSIGGILTERTKSLDSQISLQQDRISQFDERLAQRQQILEAQFLAMEQALAQLQSQSNTLSMLG